MAPTELPNADGETVRIEPMDASAARKASVVLEQTEPWSRYAETIREVLSAIEEHDAEHLGIVATVAAQPVGFALYHMVAGTEGTAAITAIVADAEDVCARLLRGALAQLLRKARLIVAEFPGGRAFAPYRRALEAHGFERVAEVSDYYGDDVPLVIMRHEPVTRSR